MKYSILILGAAFALSTATVAAQQQQQQAAPPQQPQEQQQPKTEEVTLTGCVVQGSSPTIFIFDNAKVNPANKDEKGRTFVLIAGAEDLQFKPHLNHQVTFSGKAEIKTLPVVPPGQKAKEVDLPRLTAVRVTEVSQTCTASLR